jgi:hypothetical protein
MTFMGLMRSDRCWGPNALISLLGPVHQDAVEDSDVLGFAATKTPLRLVGHTASADLPRAHRRLHVVPDA